MYKTSVYRRWPTREALVAAAMAGLLDDFGDRPDTGTLLATATPIAELAAPPRRRRAVPGAAGDIAALAASRVGDRVATVFTIAERARGEWRPAPTQQVIFALVGAILHRTLLERADPTGAWLVGLVDLVHDGVADGPRR